MQDGGGPRVVTKLLLVNRKSVPFPDFDCRFVVTTKSIAVWKNCKYNFLERSVTLTDLTKREFSVISSCDVLQGDNLVTPQQEIYEFSPNLTYSEPIEDEEKKRAQ